MCLEKITKVRPTKTTEDIIAYKALKRYNSDGGTTLCAPWYSFTYDVGKLFTEYIGPGFFKRLFKKEVHDGFHFYERLEDAETLVRVANTNNEETAEFYKLPDSIGYVVAECTIPAGSQVFYGFNPNGTPGIVSNQIVINKIIE